MPVISGKGFSVNSIGSLHVAHGNKVRAQYGSKVCAACNNDCSTALATSTACVCVEVKFSEAMMIAALAIATTTAVLNCCDGVDYCSRSNMYGEVD
jgi:hypothetical protein